MMRENMQRMMSSLLLPLSFLFLIRRVLGQVVLEKEKGILEYLSMNSMSETANNIAYVLYETLVSGLLVSLCTDLLCYIRLQPEDFHLVALLHFNVAMSLFISGATALALVISKGFKSASFAVQVGSIAYLGPIFLSMYIQVMEVKHEFASASNKQYQKMSFQQQQEAVHKKDSMSAFQKIQYN
mmetsp:Transcript_3730/g.5637  ORF Transcript_3730/g.5637 Transcript_3730/m.5637 type:complete len:184 (-) Transcript_3730:3989-4540(-)